MGMIKAEPAYPFSGFSGQLLFNGEPASNAKLIRQYRLQNQSDTHEDSVTSDKDGRFSFESILIQYREPIFSSHEFLSHQEIFVEFQGEKFQIWGGGKTEKKEYSEFGGKPNNLGCELTEEPRKIKKERLGFIGTNCHWTVD